MKVKAAIKEYEVRLEDDLSFLQSFGAIENAFFVVDSKVWDLYGEYFHDIPKNALYLVDAVENRKTIETALDICERMVSMNAKRNAHLVSIGGGITQDLTGFAANVLYRGIAWTFVPTTLLAACDSCIGGKTSLNYKSYKNLLGTFYPPDTIYICPSFFETLSDSDLKSGLGEVVKFNVMGGERALARLEDSLPDLLALDASTVNEFVKNSLEYKKGIIEEDEFDGGRRIYLNFAHTFGHAFEVSSGYRLPHGSAVAVGMVAANKVSQGRGLLDGDLAKRVENVVSKVLPSIDFDFAHPGTVVRAIRKDKKQTGEQLTAVLLDSSFELRVVHDMTELEVLDACEYADDFAKKLG